MGCSVYFYSGAYDQDLKRELNADQLFSIYHEKRLVIDTIMYKREHPECTAKIMLDSGAFTLYQKYKKNNETLPDDVLQQYVDDYIDFLNEWGDDLFCFVAVDSVPDPTNVDQSFAQKTWDNYLYMYSKLKESVRDKLIPVFHYGEDFKWLRNMLEYRHEDGSPVDYIGLAISLEGTRKVRITWGQECMKIIERSSNPNVKTHAFGVGVKSVLDNINVTSTDATSWVKRAAYGMISIDDKTIYVSDIQKKKLCGNHYGERSMAFQEEVEKIIKDRGFRFDPEIVPFTLEENTARFTLESGDVIAVRDGDKLTVKTSEKTQDYDAVDYNGTIIGEWKNDDRSVVTFQEDGTVIYDNGRCLATDPYARARFNILDTQNWMKPIEKKVVTGYAIKKSLF